MMTLYDGTFMLGFFKKNRESNVDLIDRYISTWKKYDYNLNYKTENYQKTNRLAKELLHIENSIEENESFLEIYKEIILKCIETIGGIALNISIYETNLGKKMYTRWYESDKEKNFVGKYTLHYWDKNMADWKENKQEKIEKYNKWKKENPKEYERIIKEINIIIDDYKI